MDQALQSRAQGPKEAEASAPMFDLIELFFFAYRDFVGDADRLRAAGLAEPHIAALRRHVPRTVTVTAADADALWAARNKLFFKPATGHGSKAVYRGDKLTRGA